MFSKDVLLFLCQVSMVYVFDMPLIVLFSVRTFHFHILVGANCFGYAFFLSLCSGLWSCFVRAKLPQSFHGAVLLVIHFLFIAKK